MIDEEKLVGPFTLRQFLYFAGGFGLVYVASIYVQGYGLLAIALAVGLPVFGLIRQSTPPPLDANYIQTKRRTFADPLKYRRWLQRKIALAQSQKAERESHGFIADPVIDEAIELLENALRETTP